MAKGMNFRTTGTMSYWLEEQFFYSDVSNILYIRTILPFRDIIFDWRLVDG